MRRNTIHLLLIALLSACGDAVVFQADTALPGEVWVNTFKPSFAFDVTDTTTANDIFIDVRHTGDYEWSDIWLFTTIEGPGIGPITDTSVCLLAGPTGQWRGKGLGFIHSDRFDAKLLWKSNNRFPRTGRYTITLEQAMRTDTLRGVIDVGVSVERSAVREQ